MDSFTQCQGSMIGGIANFPRMEEEGCSLRHWVSSHYTSVFVRAALRLTGHRYNFKLTHFPCGSENRLCRSHAHTQPTSTAPIRLEFDPSMPIKASDYVFPPSPTTILGRSWGIGNEQWKSKVLKVYPIGRSVARRKGSEALKYDYDEYVVVVGFAGACAVDAPCTSTSESQTTVRGAPSPGRFDAAFVFFVSSLTLSVPASALPSPKTHKTKTKTQLHFCNYKHTNTRSIHLRAQSFSSQSKSSTQTRPIPNLLILPTFVVTSDRWTGELLRRLNTTDSPTFHGHGTSPPHKYFTLNVKSGYGAKVTGYDRPETTTPLRLCTFDLIRMSCVTLCVPTDSWAQVFEKVYRVLAYSPQVDDRRYHHLPAPTKVKRYGLLCGVALGQLHVSSTERFYSFTLYGGNS
ncbi:uncharacterized protein LACBIDRAFT_324439 [Laccaria bicolor S238N-H82]|uniref:Predicted protein n=1 Tax=Laccaria bicolor (strain S238N-H82 / ATCC MYA-4686) TaxID=486041 RepID=B0D1T8_LACBS|nr:uncharacterized protein LACBIDRAFT_324439 [Laccaria bicolor S238N-H82]EDR11701.1 predicted protein [Laccaria bicolor S238N-H82]|eukprot:XP_001877598.1 predicted protein [Laccaria bicolor S238N-H82]